LVLSGLDSQQLRQIRHFAWLIFSISSSAFPLGAGAQNQLQNSNDAALAITSQKAEFILPDGTQGSVEQLNGKYAIRFQNNARLLAIENATSVKFRSAQVVAGYTLIVLDQSSPQCPKSLRLMALRGNQIQSWDIGNCKVSAEVSVDSYVAHFDVPDGKMATRYEFTEGRLNTFQVAYTPLLSGVVDFASPITPAVAASAPASTAQPSNAASNQKPGSVSARTTPITVTGKLVFKPKEPTTIYLDK